MQLNHQLDIHNGWLSKLRYNQEEGGEEIVLSSESIDKENCSIGKSEAFQVGADEWLSYIKQNNIGGTSDNGIAIWLPSGRSWGYVFMPESGLIRGNNDLAQCVTKIFLPSQDFSRKKKLKVKLAVLTRSETACCNMRGAINIWNLGGIEGKIGRVSFMHKLDLQDKDKLNLLFKPLFKEVIYDLYVENQQKSQPKPLGTLAFNSPSGTESFFWDIETTVDPQKVHHKLRYSFGGPGGIYMAHALRHSQIKNQITELYYPDKTREVLGL